MPSWEEYQLGFKWQWLAAVTATTLAVVVVVKISFKAATGEPPRTAAFVFQCSIMTSKNSTSQSVGSTPMGTHKRNSDDIGWEYGFYPDENKMDTMKYLAIKGCMVNNADFDSDGEDFLAAQLLV
ncbi:unnamed protein product [Lactuca saligna]|uniref:Uncharacterized protein n=1 Tax=Lactuca saligna TaxID=75948 RepID=A0AA35YE06_LACSI|nr:unnamed protein product [Lactuca saligna]